MSERKETNEVGSYNHVGFLLGGTFWTVPWGRIQTEHGTPIEKTETKFRKAKGIKNFQGMVVKEKELYPERSPEICLGIPLSL